MTALRGLLEIPLLREAGYFISFTGKSKLRRRLSLLHFIDQQAGVDHRRVGVIFLLISPLHLDLFNASDTTAHRGVTLAPDSCGYPEWQSITVGSEY